LKQNFIVTPPAAMATRLFWNGAAFDGVVTTKNRISRMASVTVYSYEEAVEL
jgi:hypothetical protein